jgi:hypothetical protein
MRTRWLGLALLGVLTVLALVAATKLWAPPPPEPTERAAVAGRLETVLPLLDELGVTSWRDEGGGCHYVTFTDGVRHQDPAGSCGDSAPFDEQARAAWERIAAAFSGTVPGGRLRSLDEMDHFDPSLGPGRHVLFLAVPHSLLGQDMFAARWLWTWDEQAAGPGGDGLPAHWRFDAYDEAMV